MQALREINHLIWEPFARGVNTFDALYSRVRSKDSIFVDDKRFFGYEACVEDAIRIMAPLQASGTHPDASRSGLRTACMLQSAAYCALSKRLGSGLAIIYLQSAASIGHSTRVNARPDPNLEKHEATCRI